MPGEPQAAQALETKVPIRFTIGSRHILSVPRQLSKVSYSLEELTRNVAPELPALAEASDGYRVFSAPQDSVAPILAAAPGYLAGGRHDYRRHYIDMSGGYDAYLSGFSSKTRSTLRRKQRKLEREAAERGGEVSIREYRSPSEIAEFMTLAPPLARRTYQARDLEAALPDDDAARAAMRDLATQDNLRCYLLYFCGTPISYLALPISGDTVIYAFLGYDEDYARLSPGTVLQMHALERLFAEERYRYFDFTEGDGAHKAMFGNRAVEACSFFLLKATAGNRVLLASLGLFDAGVAGAKAMLAKTGALSKIRQAIRRA